jgi:hypothetical protein
MGTREASRIPRPAKPFLILEARSSQGIAGCVTVPEPSLARRRGPEPWNT